MSVIIILVGASLIVATGFLISFFWAVRSGQYEDEYSSSVRILFDNEPTKENNVSDK
jgi:cbb3-type cytochrome oxidase maturation protein